MIKLILEEYEQQKSAISKNQEILKNENKAIAKNMTEMYIGSVNKDVRQIHTNQKRIIEEIRKLKSGTQELMKQANNWIDLYMDYQVH